MQEVRHHNCEVLLILFKKKILEALLSSPFLSEVSTELLLPTFLLPFPSGGRARSLRAGDGEILRTREVTQRCR